MTIETTTPLSRRGLLAAAVAGTAAAIAGVASRAERVFAAGDDGQNIVIGGNYRDVRTVTSLQSDDTGAATILYVRHDDLWSGGWVFLGKGVQAHAYAKFGAKSAVSGESDGVGVLGRSVAEPDRAKGIGVQGLGRFGVSGEGRVGVEGIGTGRSGRGIQGSGQLGGHFRGERAQVRLVPGKLASHPRRGNAGDLYVDKGRRLWFCKGGRNWVTLA